MDVGVDEAGEDVEAGDVDNFGVGGRGELAGEEMCIRDSSSSETPARGRSPSRNLRSFSEATCRSAKETGGGANARRLMASASSICRPRICSITDFCAGDNASALKIIDNPPSAQANFTDGLLR